MRDAKPRGHTNLYDRFAEELYAFKPAFEATNKRVEQNAERARPAMDAVADAK